MKTHAVKTILILSICMALQMTSFVIILPLFARRFGELGAGVEALGISGMAYALTSTLAAPFMGALADRFGRRPLVLVSLAAYVAAFCGYLLAQSAMAIIVIRGLAGALTAGLIPAATGLAVDVASSDRQAQWIGFINGGAAVGWIVGPIAGGLIYDQWGYSAALTVSISMAVLTLLIALLGIPESRPARFSAETAQKAAASNPKNDGVSLAGNIKTSLRHLRSTLPSPLFTFFILLLIFFTVLFAWSFIEPRFMFYVYDELGWSSSRLGLVMGTYGAAMVLGELAFGRLSDHMGRKPVILLGLVLFSAQFFGLAFFKNDLLIAASFIIAGMGNALYDPALSASFLDISPDEHRARILGIKGMVGSTGSILGPALIAVLNSTVDARSIFLAAAGAVLLLILVVLLSPASERRPVKQPVQIPAPE